MQTEGDGTVFVAEDMDPEDAWLVTGTFSAHWQSTDRSVPHVYGPAGVSADEALSWASAMSSISCALGEAPPPS
jgi:hypothetical protein